MSKSKTAEESVQDFGILGSMYHGGSDSGVFECLKDFDIASIELQCFQSDNGKQFTLRITDDAGDSEFEADFNAARNKNSIREQYEQKLSLFGAVLAAAAQSLEAVQREALQSTIVLAHLEELKTGLAELAKHGLHVEFQNKKKHESHPFSEGVVMLRAEDVELVKLVASATLARYVHTEGALPTRARTKRAHTEGSSTVTIRTPKKEKSAKKNAK